MEKLAEHPSREELSAYSLGQIPEERAVAIDSHISECEPCCETIVELSSEDTFAGLLQEAGRLATNQTADHGSATANSDSFDDIPQPLSEHPRYEILSLIGKGGMGDVYKARHRKMERTVALKVINRGLVQKAEAIDRFHREVKAAAQLSHPNIVTSHDADHAGDFHFMVMEFVDGVDLSQTVKKRGALPFAEACDYIRQAANGLQHAHQRGMVHRDIKPHNMMVTADGTVKILDFGLASLAPEALADADSVEACGELTAAGAIMGTPDFISPEQAQDARQADIRSDIYSLGATLYFLLSGRPLFADGSVMHKVESHANAEPEPLQSLRDDLPPKLAAVVSRMIAKNPDERFQTPAEVVEALESLEKVTQPGQSRAPVRQVQPSRRRIGWLPLTAIATIFLAAIFAGLVYYIQTNNGVVRVEVTDDSLAVDISGHTVTAKDGNKKPVEIHVGDCVLKVRQGDFQFETESFQVRRNQQIAFKVEWLEGEVVVSKDGEQFHSQALSDDKLLQGDWETESLTEGGKSLAAENGFGSLLLQIKGNTFVIAERNANGKKSEVDTGHIEINSTATPKTIDFIGRVERRLGIYELKEGVLRVCLVEQAGTDAPAGARMPDTKPLKRPTAFESPVGSNMMLMVFQQKESTAKTQVPERVDEVQAERTFKFDLSLVPANAQQVVGARPGRILRDPQLAKLREDAPPLAGFTSLFVNENVAEVLAIALPNTSRMSNPRVIILTVEQGDAMEEVDRAIGILKLAQGDAESEYKSTGYVSRGGRLLVRQIDRKTVVLGTREELDGHKLAVVDPMPNEFREVAKGMHDCEVFLIANPQDLWDFGPEEASAKAGIVNEILKQLRFLHGETKFVAANVSLGEKPRLQLSFRAKAQERNHEVAMAVSEIRDQAMTLIRGNLNQLSDGLFLKDQESAAAATASLLLSRVTEPTPQDTLLDVPLMPAMSTVVKMLGEQFDAKKLQRNVARFNMKSISLGFFQFEAKYGYLPSAATKIPGCALPVSWRVAILPYVGQEKLYAQYKLDEPWDSEHNKTLLAKMPELYRHPSSWRQSTETNVVSFVGADTAVGTGDEPVRLGDFQDDLRLTILVAESATGIPWTKPADVPFTPGEPLPPIGGLGLDGWNAVFADGSVQFVPRNTSTDVIAAMLTRNGGESVQDEDGKFSLRKVGEQSRQWHPEAKESKSNRAPAANDSRTDDTPDSSLNNAANVESLPLVQVLRDAEGLTAKRVKIIGTFLVTDNKFGVRTYQISTAKENLPPRPNEDAYRDREVTFEPSFDDEKIINVGQFHNKRVVATGPIYFFPADADSPAEVVFMMDGIHEHPPQGNANEEVPSAVPGEGLSMLHNQPDDISEFSAEPMSFIRKVVLPQDFDTEGAGWERFGVSTKGARGGTASGVPENLRPVLAKLPQPKLALQKLADEVEMAVNYRPQWKAGVALLGFLEAELGNEKRAVKLFEQVLAEKEHAITPEAAWIFGLALEGKGPQLDQIVTTLYEINVEGERDPSVSIRESAIGSLSRLYANDGRRDEAKRLLQRLTEPEGPYVVCPWARGPLYKDRCTECHQQERSLENYILMANALTDIGAPVEARMSLARIGVSFKNAYDSDEAWATANTFVPDWEYQGKEAFQPAKAKAESRITPQLILKALESGVFNEPNPLKTAGREPVFSIDLVLGVRGENGKSTLFSPVIDMLSLAAKAKGDDAEVANIQIDRMLADAFQKTSSWNNPNQLEVGIAATVFAFLRNDLDSAEKRIDELNKPLPLEELRKTAVGLCLVAREALKHERTREIGEKLTERALAAAEQQVDPLWAKAIREEQAAHDQNAIRGTVEEIDKLNATAIIAAEIQRDFKIECDPYYRSVFDVAQIELKVSDLKFEHQSLATKVTKLKSVQSFNGTLHLIFRSIVVEAGSTPVVVTYDAKTGNQLER